jgi:DNA polymerase III sliding clamp (beta) subunit (PCNA family)
MKFNIAPITLKNLIKTACSGRVKKKDNVTLTATANRLMVECNGTSAATDAAASEEGAYTIHAQTLRKIVNSFNGAPWLEFQTTANGLCIQNFRIEIVS